MRKQIFSSKKVEFKRRVKSLYNKQVFKSLYVYYIDSMKSNVYLTQKGRRAFAFAKN
jgi:hypothetical protein